MKLQTITTIELSSICNLQCKYCINRYLQNEPNREPGIMHDGVFEKSLDWLKILVSRGTQKEVNLNGNGESTLDPDLVSRVRQTKDVMGKGTVMFCTNGKLMTKSLAHKLMDAGIDRVDLSVHSPYHARRCADLFMDIGLRSIINFGAITSSHNWAGQLPERDRVRIRFDIPCHPIIEGRGYINSEGDLSPCCYDYRNLGRFGSVFNDDLLDREVLPFELCLTCHQRLPQTAKEKAA